jgi:hypothetical protein
MPQFRLTLKQKDQRQRDLAFDEISAGRLT